MIEDNKTDDEAERRRAHGLPDDGMPDSDPDFFRKRPKKLTVISRRGTYGVGQRPPKWRGGNR